MNCEQARGKLALWVGGDLPADEQAAIDEHLATCADCRAEAEAWRADRERMIEFVRWNEGPELEPSRLDAMIAAATAAAGTETAAPATRGLWRWAPPIAALLAVFVFWRFAPLPGPHPQAPAPVADAGASWEQLQAAFDGCLAAPVVPAAWRAVAGPGLVAVLTRRNDRYVLADCIETPDLERISRYPWLEQRLERYRRQGDDGLYLAVCAADGMDRGRRRALRIEVLHRFGEPAGKADGAS